MSSAPSSHNHIPLVLTQFISKGKKLLRTAKLHFEEQADLERISDSIYIEELCMKLSVKVARPSRLKPPVVQLFGGMDMYQTSATVARHAPDIV